MADTTQKVYDLDEELQEYFVFKAGGFTYRMYYPTIEQVEEIDGAKALKDVLLRISDLIKTEDEKAPQFRDACKKMSVTKIKRIIEILKMGISGDGSN